MRTSSLVFAGPMLALALALTAGCDDTTGPSTGTIRVSLTSSGPDIDHDGYRVSVDGGSARIIGATGSVAIPGVEPGTHTVRLDGLATNCTVDGGGERTVNVVAGGEVSAAFAVSCVARAGSIHVTTVTSGRDLDANGYMAEIRHVATQRIEANGAVTFPGIRESSYEVRLTDVAPNCVVAAPVAHMVVVTFDAVTEVAFAVQCVAAGSLRVTSVTSGPDPDANGYTVQIGREGFSTSTGVAAGGTATTSGLLPGTYHVTITGVAENCALVGPATRLVEVGEGATTEVTLEVVCARATRLAFVSERDGNSEIYAVNSNGSGITRLTNDPGADLEPVWSPDGSKIAFTSTRGGRPDIYVMDADGSNVARRTSSASDNTEPSWSPDGSRIAFVSQRDGNAEIYVMNADGTNQARLTNDAATDYAPAWSPDGSRIAFASWRSNVLNVYVMNADGSAVTRLTNSTSQGVSYSLPAWSPDGQRLAVVVGSDCYYYYYYYCEYTVQLLNASGSVVVGLGTTEGNSRPAWSPDGRTVAFSTSICDARSCTLSVLFARADRSRTDVLIPDGHSPSWRR